MSQNITKKDARYRDTRNRLLIAARKELIKYGVSGARIDRIASQAGTSKERLYAYFKNKADLINTVAFERMLYREKKVPFDAENLLLYVGDLFDFYIENPDDIALVHSINLETLINVDDPRLELYALHCNEIEMAQEKGLIDDSWDPLTLLNLLISIAMAWPAAPAVAHAINSENHNKSLSDKRAAALLAAGRLLTPS